MISCIKIVCPALLSAGLLLGGLSSGSMAATSSTLGVGPADRAGEASDTVELGAVKPIGAPDRDASRPGPRGGRALGYCGAGRGKPDGSPRSRRVGAGPGGQSALVGAALGPGRHPGAADLLSLPAPAAARGGCTCRGRSERADAAKGGGG